MKTLTSKKKVQKILIAIVIVLLCNFIIPNYSQADFGGVLAGPIIDLFAGIGDVVLTALQFFMYDGTINTDSAIDTAIDGAGQVANTALTLVNPFASFMLLRGSDNFFEKLQEYDMYVSGGGEENLPEGGDSQEDTSVDIELDSENFDKGWLGWLPFGIADKDYGVPIIKYTPEAIFGNQVPALDVNFINPRQWEEETQNDHSITQDLHSTVANWYVALRNLAIVILLSVLIYVGIRMVISSTASDKAKYKQMLMDWIIAICIVFFLHYVMSFILTITEMITEGLSSGTSIVVGISDPAGDYSIRTNLTGLCRLQVQYSELGARMIYLIFYLALVIYTVMFTWTYVKRAIVMAFLTLMAPLVAITYPIDKISDGKAQAFGIWLKEFIFNALLQPFHLIIYTVFLGAASEIAVKNPIYAILFLAFITPAEKLLRKMFGFEKSSTAGAMGAAAGILGGAAVLRSANSLIGRAGKGKSGGKTGVRTKGNGTVTRSGDKKLGEAFGNGESAEIDSERANLFRSLRDSGMSQEEAMAQVDRDLPFNREQNNNIDRERASMFRNLVDSGMSQEEAMAQVNGALPLTRTQQPLTQQRQSQQTQARTRNLTTPNNGQPVTPSAGTSNPPVTANSIRTRTATENGKTWTPDDNRGLGEWISDEFISPRMNAAKESISNTRAGKFVRKKAEGINDIRSKANNAIQEHVPKPLRNTIKGAVGTVGRATVGTAKFAGKAAVGATFGLAAGITGDELEDVAKYGLAGTALGVTGLPVIGRAVANTGRNVRNTYEQQAFGEEEAALRAQSRELMRNKDYQEKCTEHLTETLGRAPKQAEVRTFMRAGTEYYNSGITDTKSIIKAVDLEREIKGQLRNDGTAEAEAAERARDQAKVIAKMADQATEKDLRDEKYVNGLKKSFTNELVNKGNMGQEDAGIQADHIIAMIKKQKGVY